MNSLIPWMGGKAKLFSCFRLYFACIKGKEAKQMEAKKNLCAMIPAELHNRLRQEQEQLGLTLNAYVEKLINEHFEGGKTAMTEGTRTLAL